MDNKGFSLIELMIVLLIIGVMSTILVPNYNKIQIKAKEQAVVQIVNKLQVAIESYYLDTGAYPDGEDLSVTDLESFLFTNNDISSFSVNPFTGAQFSSSDESGQIYYSLNSETGGYSIQGFGHQNANEIVSIGSN